jgi:hypothetical protein
MRIRIFILWLEKNHRPTVRYLSLRNYGTNTRSVQVSSMYETRIVRTECCVHVGKPAWKATTTNFSIDVRSRTRKQVNTRLRRGVKKRLERENAISPEQALLTFEKSPISIEGNTGVSQSLDLLKHI